VGNPLYLCYSPRLLRHLGTHIIDHHPFEGPILHTFPSGLCNNVTPRPSSLLPHLSSLRCGRWCRPCRTTPHPSASRRRRLPDLGRTSKSLVSASEPSCVDGMKNATANASNTQNDYRTSRFSSTRSLYCSPLLQYLLCMRYRATSARRALLLFHDLFPPSSPWNDFGPDVFAYLTPPSLPTLS